MGLNYSEADNESEPFSLIYPPTPNYFLLKICLVNSGIHKDFKIKNIKLSSSNFTCNACNIKSLENESHTL